MATTSTTTHYGEAIREQRTKAGFSLSVTRDLLRDSIPHRYVPSIKTLQRIEKGEIPEEKVDGLLIYGLAYVFRCRISDLSTLVADEYDALGDLVSSSSPWITVLDGQLDLFAPAA